ncbi:MAG: cytochrome P450 [Oligoflexia bacterium]|nr:cytochrome P450 [Oligoflexia bacterium]
MNKSSTKNQPPSPKSRWFLEHAIAYSKDPVSFLERVTRECGDIGLIPFPGYRLYVINHPDLIEQVLKIQQSKFKKDIYTKLTSIVLGAGLLGSDGEFWRKQRRLVQPAFHHHRTNNYGKIFVQYTHQMMAKWNGRTEITLLHEMTELTLKIVAKTLFNSDIETHIKTIEECVEAMMDYFLNVLNLAFKLPLWVPTPDNLKVRKHKKATDNIIFEIIRQRRASNEDPGDLLSMLLNAQDADDGTQMSDQQIRDEVITLFMAGHETTALALSFTIHLLSTNPHTMMKVREELKRVLNGKDPELADLARLTYLRQVIMESMRLYPPAWSMGREATEEIKLRDYVIPKGSQIGIVQWAMHRDARYFDEPLEFKPERWEGEFAKTIPPFAYFPFGGGPRICIGKEFAMMEITMVLATLLQHFEIQVYGPQKLEVVGSVTLRPKHSIRARISPLNLSKF